jgi:hypothetical protein
MIRHHAAQDQLSADATSIYPWMAVTVPVHAAPHPDHVAAHSAAPGGDEASSSHPLAFYAAPASTLMLVVLSVVALLELMRMRRALGVLRPLSAGKTAGMYFIKSARYGYTIGRRHTLLAVNNRAVDVPSLNTRVL